MLSSARRIEAQYSSPVKVLNTSAAPVLNSRIDDPGRVPYMAFTTTFCSGTTCGIGFPAVPAGHRLVLQHLSGFLNFNAPPTTLFGFIESTQNFRFNFNVPLPPAGNATHFDQQVLYFVDGGDAPSVFIGSTGAPFPGNVGEEIVLAGYELDCNAAPCAAIANH
jgi:hypothetical protein